MIDVTDNPLNLLTTSEKALQLQRNRRRKTQQRYRKRLEGKASTLAEEVSKLKAEVQHVELRLRCPPCVATNSTPWRTVVEFFRLFRNGFQGPTTIESLLLPETHTQKRFLRATMAPNVAFNDGYGVDANLLGAPRKIQVQLVRLEQGPDDLLLAYLVISEVIPRETLLNCFGGRMPTFALKLLGLELDVPVCVHFRWNEQEKRFDSVHYIVVMLAPLVKLLGNLEDATAVLTRSLVNELSRHNLPFAQR
ncbi:hypothetical protein P3T76_005996 [Phytophthora citrophthora]|uniref:BZIP domain-containing protein n=1 Tax=Phytophthora citrophthora TaxID=4793 RepID=A0AAD9GPT3_9STRA|nr:hypothetical protein P3T76_005996 [Phytophthora citrophthora]